MTTQEPMEASAPYRIAYRDGMHALVAARRALLDDERRRTVTPEAVAADAPRWRAELARLLGWPLTQPHGKIPRVAVREDMPHADGITLRRLQIEVLPGLPLYGLLLTHNGGAARPLVLSLHGGGGTPELAADMHGPNNYRNMTTRLLRHGFHVFAPQLLLWSDSAQTAGIPGYRLPNHRAELDTQLRQLGGCIAGVETFALMRALDHLAELPRVLADHIGAIGLSYGGFYTQMLAALDTRVRVAVSNAFFNDRYAYCWPDFSWMGAAKTMRDAEICALIAPRALCVHVGRNDGVFSVPSALPELERLRLFYAAQNAENQLNIIVSGSDHTLTETGEEMDFLVKRLSQTRESGAGKSMP